MLDSKWPTGNSRLSREWRPACFCHASLSRMLQIHASLLACGGNRVSHRHQKKSWGYSLLVLVLLMAYPRGTAQCRAHINGSMPRTYPGISHGHRSLAPAVGSWPAACLLSCCCHVHVKQILDKLCLGVEAARYRTVQGGLL